MKNYETPMLTVLTLGAADVIATSDMEIEAAPKTPFEDAD